MQKIDVIVIGAGPGGLSCAKRLAELKIDVAVFEKNSSINRKICTGLWGLNGKTKKINLPEEVFERKFNKVIVSTLKNSMIVETKSPFVATLDRTRLGEWMLEEAEEAGAQIFFDSPVIDIGDNFINVNGQKYFFNSLVGADGSFSLVRRKLGLPTKAGIGIQYWLEDGPKELEIHLDYNRFGPWYSWIAPHKNLISIGTGGDLNFKKVDKFKNALDGWLSERKINSFKTQLEGSYICHEYHGFKFGNKYLIGDAAGLPSSLTGEGIYPAIVSGIDVANIIFNSEHSPKFIFEVLKIKRLHNVILRLFKINPILTKIEHKFFLWLLKNEHFKNKVIEFLA